MAAPVSPVTLQVTVNGQVITDFIQNAELKQWFYKHELYILRIEYKRLGTNLNALPIWPDNATVQVSWGRGLANTATWYGYVNHHEYASNADSGSYAPQVTYYCIGTSKPMNSEVTRTWGQASPTYMAKQIAAEHNLRAVLTSTSWVSDYEVQSAESDFAFLVRMGEKYGFRFAVSGGTLYFIDPASVLAASSTQAIPSFNLDKSFIKQDTIRDFKKISGDNIPGSEQATRVISGVDAVTGVPFTVAANGSQAITKIQTGRVATSVAEATVMAQAWQNQAQFYTQATAELFGNAMLYPGKLVYLKGLALPADSGGYWMVSEAKHLLKVSGTNYTILDKFVTRVKLLRNQGGAAPSITNTSIIRPEFVGCQALGGTWQATQLGALYDGVLQ